MEIKHHKKFQKNYKARIAPYPKLSSRFAKRLGLFIRNPNDLLLKDHGLTGEKYGYRAFSITGDVRVVYKIVENTIWFYDIGSHNQVY